MNEKNERTIQLIGMDAFMRLQSAKVVVAGLGGVGGHCAEALARAGVGRLHLIDCDTVSASNLNRQIVATKRTIGMKKVDAMRARIEDVSDCVVTTSDVFLCEGEAMEAVKADADFIIDAIDSVPGKLALALFAKQRQIPIVSCMGAGNRLDPMRFRVVDLFETSGCPLARKMRHELRKRGIASLPVVVSDEVAAHVGAGECIGSIATVPGAAGLCLASYALKRLMQNALDSHERRDG